MTSGQQPTANSSLLSIERVVTLLLPIFTAASGYVVAWAAKNLPGLPPLDKTQLTALFATGAIAGASGVLKWLHGRQNPKLIGLEHQFSPELTAVAGELGTVVPAPLTEGQIKALIEPEVKAVLAKIGTDAAQA